ncbi:ExbD/TolR family protein [Tuwongella immobilis]|uniref:Biopolymer transporter ExbD n=1 Tax=Tuwongella immobilis TaxID=692036 RepID=A0A6C2YTF8_9BACT|nr:biopolymer transporter ExbD [Tuwongella immobilis]VIP04172.1 biopolymer transporter : Biopolymer transport protein ExbD/TolR OS=Hyalangium minutum GN=DB31_6951 PE=3 SV=1: ExbD [Tuwongella immobilis]VTS05709.1 biopolymer transporter : Biopolymer transport protein ExbD/TolR OS=Hyalangium minutum GN=DB31_6951 PE=3 SV=1: ExbD [Tuwongella immobilis]
MSATRWMVRPAGSALAGETLTDEEILDAIREDVWEPTDEVRGPHDRDWQPLETHPHFAKAIEEMLPPTPIPMEDDTRLDMNPLIDVALVLLIFFMLKTAVDFERKAIELPTANVEKEGGKGAKPRSIQKEEVQQLIRIVARKEGNQSVIRVDEEVVRESDLEKKIRQIVERERKTEVFLDTQGVPWGVEVKILDAIKGAGITATFKRVRKEPVG